MTPTEHKALTTELRKHSQRLHDLSQHRELTDQEFGDLAAISWGIHGIADTLDGATETTKGSWLE